MSPKSAQRIVAVIVFAILAIDWFTQVPQPTRPGIAMGGTGMGSGLVFAIAGAAAWYLATRRVLVAGSRSSLGSPCVRCRDRGCRVVRRDPPRTLDALRTSANRGPNASD